MDRRQFFKALLGTTVAFSAGGIALLEHEPVRTYFLPPRRGWAKWATDDRSFELVLATEALRIVTEKLGSRGLSTIVTREPGYDFLVVEQWQQRMLDSLLARRARLVERVDSLARHG